MVRSFFDKVLASRLTEDLPSLVRRHESAFIRGRSLHDSFMLVQCMTRRLHALKDPTVMFKLDISKAIESVQWPFLLKVLKKMCFGRRWITWMCIGNLLHEDHGQWYAWEDNLQLSWLAARGSSVTDNFHHMHGATAVHVQVSCF